MSTRTPVIRLTGLVIVALLLLQGLLLTGGQDVPPEPTADTAASTALPDDISSEVLIETEVVPPTELTVFPPDIPATEAPPETPTPELTEVLSPETVEAPTPELTAEATVNPPTVEPIQPPLTTAEATAVVEPVLPLTTAESLPPEPPLTLAFADNFDGGLLDQWTLGGGWSLAASEGGQALQVTNSGESAAYAQGDVGNAAVQARFLLDTGSASLTLRYSSAGAYTVTLDASGLVSLYHAATLLQSHAVAPAAPGQWRTLRFSAVDDVLRVAVDGVEVITVRDLASLPPGMLLLSGTGTVLVDDFNLWLPIGETFVSSSLQQESTTFANSAPIEQRTFTVNDSGDKPFDEVVDYTCGRQDKCTLREAIGEINGLRNSDDYPDADNTHFTINFSLPADATILLSSTLEIPYDVTIDGLNGAQTCNPESPPITVSLTSEGDVLRIDYEDNITIRGLKITSGHITTPYDGNGIFIRNANNVSVECNLISGNSRHGIDIWGNSNIRIGGEEPEKTRNIIMGNLSSGVHIDSDGIDYKVLGNNIFDNGNQGIRSQIFGAMRAAAPTLVNASTSEIQGLAGSTDSPQRIEIYASASCGSANNLVISTEVWPDTEKKFTITVPFGSLQLNQTIAATSTYLVTDLSHPAWQTSAFSECVSVGPAVMPTPAAPELLSPADGTVFTASRAGNFAWSAVENATDYEFEIFQAQFVENIKTAGATTISQSPRLEDGLYYWRVRGITLDGRTGEWSSVWSFTIDTTPAAPSLSSPADGGMLTFYPLTPRLDTPYYAIDSFRWQEMSDAVHYQLQVAQDSSFSILEIDSIIPAKDKWGIPRPYFTPTTALTPDIYYWQVRAQDDSGNWGPYNDPPYMVTVNALLMRAPANNTDTTSVNPTFRWYAFPGASKYVLEVNRYPSFPVEGIMLVCARTHHLQSCSRSQSFPYGEYYWRVTVDAGRGPVPPPAYWTLTITPDTSRGPIPRQPANGAITGTTVTFTWDPPPFLQVIDRIYPPATYQLQVDDNRDFSSPIVNQSRITENSYTVNNVPVLWRNITYYWRVRGWTANGIPLKWWSGMSFRPVTS